MTKERFNKSKMESAITAKAQATFLKAIHEHLGVQAGDRVKIHPDGSVVLLPKRPSTALRGLIKTQRSNSIGEMNEAIASGAAGEP